MTNAPLKGDTRRTVNWSLFWQTLCRLFLETIAVLATLGFHWLVKKAAHYLSMEDEWLARYLINVTALFALIAVSVVGGSEVWALCAHGVRHAVRATRGE